MKTEAPPSFPSITWLVIVLVLALGTILLLIWPRLLRSPAIKEEPLVLATDTALADKDHQEEPTPPANSPVPSITIGPAAAYEKTPSTSVNGQEAAVLPLTTNLLPAATASPAASLAVPLTPTIPLTVTGGTFKTLGQPEKPVRIRIPAIDVNAAIETVGLTASNAMDTPEDWDNVGWYNLGYWPGQPGNAVMTGHLDAPGNREAVFWRLYELQPGDEILVDTESGNTLAFVVINSVYYPYDSAPLWRIFGPNDEPRLNLITCRGDWDRQLRTYDNRLVVFTRQTHYWPEERPSSLPVD